MDFTTQLIMVFCLLFAAYGSDLSVIFRYSLVLFCCYDILFVAFVLIYSALELAGRIMELMEIITCFTALFTELSLPCILC